MAAVVKRRRKRYVTRSCGAMGGRSQRTGKPVGQYHRWGGLTQQFCEFCGHHRDEVKYEVKP